ncbi:hypothetical protein [Proteiniclasticum sp. QWL-01]|uniref:YczE/YyaS/YitT family protein n=1 Tax=Proteiniclasticum sp. QWL-01 TaxID=3036945 RepID=UPI0024110070|nr:hypothetical protein [Proteiniclasticum sp. QWL-01]WFF74237.1 hypothetical protein P6M73_07255 [Proteiniclasticum sp. QWL-01]
MDFSKRALPLRLLVLAVGLTLYAVGISVTVRASIGFSPWDVLHQGISNHTGLSFGTVSTLVGIVILLFNSLWKERIGFATIANAVMIGIILDVVLPLIPKSQSYLTGIPMMLAGLAIIGFATAIYISVGLGAGPRDGMMLALTKVTGKDVALIRNAIEIIVTLLGFILGGPVGLGTVITALSMGFFVKLAFSVTGFDPSRITHQYLGLSLVKDYLARQSAK